MGGPSDASPIIDAAPEPDACVPSSRVSTQFMVTRIVGNGASSLDQLLNHPNGFIVSFDDSMIIRAAESPLPGGPIVFKLGVKSASWMMDYTGQDGDFLDAEIGRNLTRGGAVQESIFELGSDGSVFLYVLPQDTNMHPYMDLRCSGATFEQDMGGYPIMKSTTLTGCSITFFDFRPGIQKNVIAEGNVVFELNHVSCGP